MLAFAAYLRTSTDDHQSPEDSAAWQLRLARQLIEPAGGEIVVTFHDVDQSRSLPWERRPQAASLLESLRNPHRGWSDLVIAEPQRAFAGNQFGLVYPVLVHYGVSLWVPEVGGRVDPESEAHDLLMSLFGGLAKAERNRIRHRVRAAMAAHASAGRWLGGRPPYGYALVDAGPHPNPDKASSGARLHQLALDEVTAPIVKRIFSMYVDERLGYKAIARALTDDGVPCPSAHDRERNPHRPGHAWAGSAVRAILANPRYLGRQVFGRQERYEPLIDPNQPALGHAHRMRWRDETAWVRSESATHPALVDESTWLQAQALMQSRRVMSPRPPRSRPGRYVLAGLLVCAHCGRRMQGSHSDGRAYYRCKLASADYATVPDGHPRSLAVQERRILRPLDEWLVELFAPGRIHELAAAVVVADAALDAPEVAAARAAIADAKRRIEHHLNALEAGVDPKLIADRTARAQAEIRAAEAVIAKSPTNRTPLTEGQVLDALEAIRELPTMLDDAEPELRADIYRSLGLELRYARQVQGERIESIEVRAVLKSLDLERVGGGT